MLTIKDLNKTAQLDREALASVRGGHFLLPSFFSSKSKLDFSAEQSIGQVQDIVNQNGNNVAFADDIKSVIKPTQRAQNNINFGGFSPVPF